MPQNVNIDLQVNISAEEDASKQEILDCARELYVEYGLRRTTMEDVAKRAGIGRATLYRRFSDKEQLFQAVTMRDAQRDLAEIQTAIARQKTFLDGLIEAFVLAVGMLNHNPVLQRLLATEPDTVLPFLTTGFDGVMTFCRVFIVAQIERGQKAGQLNDLPAAMTAEMILRLIQSLTLTRNGVIYPADEDSVRRFARAYLERLLKP